MQYPQKVQKSRDYEKMSLTAYREIILLKFYAQILSTQMQIPACIWFIISR